MILRKCHQILASHSRLIPLTVGLALLGVVGTIDWWTGPELDFSLFYMIPVCFVTWYGGQRFGYLTSMVSATVWLLVDRLTGAGASSRLVVDWNFATRLAFFAGSVLLLKGWKNVARTLSNLVEQRTLELRKLAAQLSAAEDAERRKLAYEVHDALSQSLSLIRMNLDAMQVELADNVQGVRRLVDSSVMVDEAIKQAKTLMFDLHPAMLDDLGLVPTLEWFSRDFAQRTGVEIVVSEYGKRLSVQTPVRNYLFRAAKELVTNAVRHGHAKEIVIVTHWEASGIRLVVDDDGSGFDNSVPRSPGAGTGLGLAGIDERVQSMGGRLTVESRANQGSRVVIELPIPSFVQEV
jgi:signal transduction histidine kinase